VSGSRELPATGTQVLTAAAGETESGHRGLHDGDEVDPDGLTLRAWRPRVTPEHLAT
jgi:hydroxyacylglutathione hydrolase